MFFIPTKYTTYFLHYPYQTALFLQKLMRYGSFYRILSPPNYRKWYNHLPCLLALWMTKSFTLQLEFTFFIICYVVECAQLHFHKQVSGSKLFWVVSVNKTDFFVKYKQLQSWSGVYFLSVVFFDFFESLSHLNKFFRDKTLDKWHFQTFGLSSSVAHMISRCFGLN